MSSIEMIPKPLASLDKSKHEQDFSLVHSSHHERGNSHAELLEEADDPDFYVGQAMLVEEPEAEVDPVVLKKASSRRSLWKKQKSEKKNNSSSRRGSRTAVAVTAEASPKKTLSPISVMEFMNSASPNNNRKDNSKHNKRNKGNGGSQHSRGRKSEYQQIDQANDTMEHHTERQLRRYSNTTNTTTTTTKSKSSQRSLTSTNKSPSSLHSIDLDELDHTTNNNNNGDIMSETESFLASTHEEDAEKIQQIQQPIIASSSDSLVESLWTQKKKQHQPLSFSNDHSHHHHNNNNNNNNKTLQRHSYHHRSTAFLDSEDDMEFFKVSHHQRRPRARSEGHVFDAVFPDDFAAEFVAQAKQEAKEKKQRRKSKKIKKSAKTTKRTKSKKKSKNRKSSKSHKSKSYQPDHSESAATDELNLVEEIVRAVQAEDDDEYYYEEEVVDEQIVPDNDDDDDDEESHTGWEDQDEQSIDEDELENDITTTHSTYLQESSSSFASAFSELYQVIQDCKTAPETGEHSESSTTASVTLSDKSLHSQKSTKSKKSRSKQRDNKKAPRRSKSEHSRQSAPHSKSTSSSKKKAKRCKSQHDVLASSSKHGRRSGEKGLDGLSERQHAKLLHRLERKLVKLEAKLHRTEKELIDTKRADAVIINGLQETVHSQQARMKEQQSELVKTQGALDSLRKQQQQQTRRRDSIPGVPQRQGSGNYEDNTDSPPRRRSVVHLLDSLVDDERSNDGTVNLLPQKSTHKQQGEQDDMPGLDDVTSLEAAAYESEEEDLVFVLQSIDRKVDTLLDNSDLASVEDLDEQISTMSKELKRVSPAKKQVPKRRTSRRSAAATTPVLSKDEKIQELFQWYNRYGSCSKKTLKGMIRKMGPSCGMEPNDVNLLPWIGQSYIDAKAMKDLLIVKGK